MAQDPNVVTPPVFNIAKIYLKGASVEMPKGAMSFNVQENLNANINLVHIPEILNDDFVEVTLRATITCLLADNSTMYVVEADYAGIFEIKGYSDIDRENIMHVSCAAILLPWLRMTIMETMGKMGVPAISLPEFNWNELLAEKRKAEANQSQNVLQAPTSSTVQ